MFKVRPVETSPVTNGAQLSSHQPGATAARLYHLLHLPGRRAQRPISQLRTTERSDLLTYKKGLILKSQVTCQVQLRQTLIGLKRFSKSSTRPLRCLKTINLATRRQQNTWATWHTSRLMPRRLDMRSSVTRRKSESKRDKSPSNAFLKYKTK